MDTIQINSELLQEFELGLDPQHPERSKIPAHILGYGEISTVIEVQAQELQGLAFKRLPLFRNLEEVEKYRVAHEEYNRLLEQEIGIHLPPHSSSVCRDQAGHPVFYIIQKQLPDWSIGNHALHQLSRQATLILITRIFQELRKVWGFNRQQNRTQVAIDSQISNWSIDGPDLEHLDLENISLSYVDTSTPLFRVRGVEQLDTELFLRSAPSFLVWILRLFYLKDVVNRYYDLHLVAVDLAANFYKEQRPGLIPDVIRVINGFFADWGIKPVEEDEVRSYYREDAFIWSLYFSLRKLDRFIHLRLLRQGYPYILPEKIKR